MKRVLIDSKEEDEKYCYLCHNKIKGKAQHMNYYGNLKEICKDCHADIMGYNYIF